jgi:hypothetical protein
MSMNLCEKQRMAFDKFAYNIASIKEKNKYQDFGTAI